MKQRCREMAVVRARNLKMRPGRWVPQPIILAVLRDRSRKISSCNDSNSCAFCLYSSFENLPDRQYHARLKRNKCVENSSPCQQTIRACAQAPRKERAKALHFNPNRKIEFDLRPVLQPQRPRFRVQTMLTMMQT